MTASYMCKIIIAVFLLPLRNSQLCVHLLCQHHRERKTEKVPHQNTMSCGQETISQGDTCSARKSKKQVEIIAILLNYLAWNHLPSSGRLTKRQKILCLTINPLSTSIIIFNRFRNCIKF